MKTDLELKKFYNVEFGKTYKIINSRGVDYFDLLGKTFHLERRLSEKHGDMTCRIHNGFRFELNTLDDYDYEEIVPLLTPKEKEYLSSVIYPFKDRVMYIIKHCGVVGVSEDISIEVKADRDLSKYVFSDAIFLPDFKVGTMYKSLITGKKYTIEELGL